MDEFLQGYITCALWSSSDESDESGGVPFDQNYSSDDLAPECLERMRNDCAKFQRDAAEALAAAYACHGYSVARAGHDFWLTRNGHGAGFWDRQELGQTLGNELTRIAQIFGSVELCLGDDKKIHLA